MAFVQKGSNTGTTTVSVTLTGVAAGNRLTAFAWNGSTTTPTTHTVADAQGSYTPEGSPTTYAGNNIWAQCFSLDNANAGSHTITATFDSGNTCDLVVVECTAPTSGATLGTNGSQQTNPGTGANALTSGNITISQSCTLLAMSSDTNNVASANEPAAGTGFTSRDNNFDSIIGSWRLESKSVSSTSAGTFTAVDGTSAFVTIAIAIAEPGAAPSLGRSFQTGPGISPDKRKMFQSRPLSQQIQGVDVTVSLTGSNATFTAGQLSPSGGDTKIGLIPPNGPGISPDYLKVFKARTLGFTQPNVTVALTGTSATFSAGTLSPATSVPLIGSAATFTAGTLAPNTAVPLTGQSGAFASGTLIPSTSVPLTGTSDAFTAGSLLPATQVPVTGGALTFSAGTLSPAIDVALLGNSATFTTGNITAPGDVTVALTGISMTITSGIITPSGGDVSGIGSNGGGGGGGNGANWSPKFEFSKRKREEIELESDAKKGISDQIMSLTSPDVEKSTITSISHLLSYNIDDDDEAIAAVLDYEHQLISKYLSILQ